MDSTSLKRKKTKRLTFDDRLQLEQLCQKDISSFEIAYLLGVSQTTVIRELKRGGTPYKADVAQRTLYK